MTPLEQAKALAAQLSSVLATIDETPPVPPQPVTKYAIVDGLNIRAAPSTMATILNKLHLGDAVTATAVVGQWATISSPMAGYVYNPSLDATRPVPKV